MGESVKSVAGESDITPLNGYIRIQGVGTTDTMHHGYVSDARVGQCKFGDVVYFPKEKIVITRVNSEEVVFVKESDIIFKVGA